MLLRDTLLVVLASTTSAVASPALYNLVDLGTFEGTSSNANGINAAGQVVGYAYTAGDAHVRAFEYDGSMHDLGTLGGSSSYATGINAAGQVVGYSYTAGDTEYHAFLYDGSMHDLGGGNFQLRLRHR